jgi:hypothetical protein
MSQYRPVGDRCSLIQKLILEKLMIEFNNGTTSSVEEYPGEALMKFQHNETMFLQDAIKLGLFADAYFAQDCYYHMIKLGKNTFIECISRIYI